MAAKIKCHRTKLTSYPTRLEADAARARIQFTNNVRNRSRSDRVEPTRSFQCPFCRMWHLAAPDKSGGRNAEVDSHPPF